jgi:hypothetical protein
MARFPFSTFACISRAQSKEESLYVTVWNLSLRSRTLRS